MSSKAQYRAVAAGRLLCVLAFLGLFAPASPQTVSQEPDEPPKRVNPAPTEQPPVMRPQQPPATPGQEVSEPGVVTPVRPRPPPGDQPPPGAPLTAQFIYEHEALNPTTRRLRGVAFLDRSAGNVARRRWTFGDGRGLDDDPNPVYAYAKNGFYQACLTVQGAGDPRLGPRLQSSICQVLYADVIAQLLRGFLGPVEDRLGISSRNAGEVLTKLSRTPLLNHLSRSERAVLEQLVADPATKASEIVAYLVRVTHERYKPFVYVYAAAGADVCRLAGNAPCNAGLSASAVVYIDLIDLTQFSLKKIMGVVNNDPYANDDQTRLASYLTGVVSIGGSLGAGLNPGFGIVFVPRPAGTTLTDDFDFNRFNPRCREQLINCILGQSGAMVSVTATALGFSASHDGSLGFETTAWSLGGSTQIVRLDLDANAVLTDAEAAMRCALDLYRRGGGLYGADIDYARAFSEAFRIEPFANPPRFAIDCGSIRCRGFNCPQTVSSLRGFREVSWGPPILLLRAIAELLPVEVDRLTVGQSGRMQMTGKAGGLLDFDIDFAPRGASSMRLGHEHFAISIDNFETVGTLGARLSGDVRLYGLNLGDTTLAVHRDPPDSDWRLNLEQRLFRYLTLDYQLQSPRAESLSLEAGTLSMRVDDVVSASDSSATFRGNVHWGSTNLGRTELVANRDGVAVRFEVEPAAQLPSWSDGPVRLSAKVEVSGAVTVSHRSTGQESATFNGDADTTSTIHITASDLGLDAFDFREDFSTTYDNIEVAVDSHGNARVPYYYPQLRWFEKSFRLPCAGECTATNPVTGKKYSIPCPDLCDVDVAVPVGVDTATGYLTIKFW